MCRIVAYLGPPVRLSSLLEGLSRGLIEQSRNAREMADWSVAGDGWRIGWFLPESGPAPGLFKSILPAWSDENPRTAPHAILSGVIVGHVRYASPNVETCFANTPLYAMDDHLWTINGMIEPWPGRISKAMRDRLDPDHEADLRGVTDGEMMGALWRTQSRRIGGRDDALALRSMLREARDLVREHGGEIRVNMILASASEILAVRYADTGEPNSLYDFGPGEEQWQGGVLIASEPMDDGPGWTTVEPDSLVRVDTGGVRVEPLNLDAPELATRRRQSA